MTKIVGDKYAGEWPRARFAEHGIEFEQSARPKSDLYHDLLPLLNARRVELLDLPRLSAQLCGLERRTGAQRARFHRPRPRRPRRPGQRRRRRTGRRRPRPPATAGQAERRVRRRRSGRPPPLPRHCGLMAFAVVAMEGADVAVVYAATSPDAAAALYSRRGGWAAVAGFLHRHGGAAAGAEARLPGARGGGFRPGRPPAAVREGRPEERDCSRRRRRTGSTPSAASLSPPGSSAVGWSGSAPRSPTRWRPRPLARRWRSRPATRSRWR